MSNPIQNRGFVWPFLRGPHFQTAFLMFMGLFCLPLVLQVEASNPGIGNEIVIFGPDSTMLDNDDEGRDLDNDNEVFVAPDDSGLTLTVPSGGSISVKVDGQAVTTTLDGQEVFIPLDAGANGTSYDVIVTYTDASGNERNWTITVIRESGLGSKSTNGESDDGGSTSDTPSSPTSAGCCACDYECKKCEDPSSSYGTASPSTGGTGAVDGGGGDSETDVSSLHWEMPFGLLPNEPDLASGSLLLSLSVPGDNSANIGNLIYSSVATMEVLNEKTSNLPARVSYSCRIRQASGLPIEFQVKRGESIGYPVGNNTNSRARIELLDSNGDFTNVIADAVSILQYRGQGGFVTFDRSSKKVDNYRTRTGRVTDFTGTDRIDIVYSDTTQSKIQQIRTDAGLLTITENSAREYTVQVYAPGQYSLTKGANGYPLISGAVARRTAVVSSDASTPDITTITVDQSGREYKYVYSYTSGVATHEWSMDRYVDDVLTVTKSKEVSYDSTGRTTNRKVIDQSSSKVPGGKGDNSVTSSKTLSPSASFGGYRHSESEKFETSKTTGLSKIERDFSYHLNPNSPGSYAKLKSHTLSDGRTFQYEYDANGRMTTRTSAWLDDNDAKVESYSYARLAETGLTVTDLDPGDYRPRTTTVTLDGNTSSKNFFESYLDSSGEYVEISEVAATASAAFGDSANFRTVRHYYAASAGAAKQGRLKSVVTYRGVGTSYDYATSTTFGEEFTTTVESQLNASLAAVPAFSTRTVTVKDSRSDLRERTSAVYPRGASGYTNYQTLTCGYDAQGFKTVDKEEDLLTNRVRVLGEYTWNGGLLTDMIDSMGLSYSFEYDGFDRLQKRTRNAIPAYTAGGVDYEAQAAIVMTYNGTLAYNDGSYGWLTRTTTTTAGGLTLASSMERDYRGRPTISTDENGYTTTHVINATGTETVTTHSNAETTTTTRYLDRRHKSTTGTASVPSFSSYSIAANGELSTTRFSAINNGPRYQTSVSNLLGQTVRTLRPALDGLSAATVTNTNHYQSGTGYLLRVSSNAADTPDSIMEYNAIGVLTRRGQSQDATLTLASDDRITSIVTGVESDGGDLWRVSKNTLYPTLDSDTAKLVSTSRSQIAGFSGDLMSRSEATDINGNLSYSESALQLNSDDEPEGIVTSSRKPASITATSVTKAYFGRTETVATPGVTGLMTYAYDALGRLEHTQDPRHTGDSDTVYVAGKNQVQSVTNANGDITSYSYYGNGALGARQVQTTTLPDTTTVSTSYDAHGLTKATWGSQIYARFYQYNTYDEMTELRTYQDLAYNIEPTATTGDSAATKWTFDAATGQLLTKRDADTKGCDYSYDTAGRLATRQSARLGADNSSPILTSYAYTDWGELDTVSYSNDPTGTRPLNYDYDRIGRLDDVTQSGTASTPGTNTHDYSYNPGNLLLDKETVTYDGAFTRELDHRQDTFLRPDQHLLLNGTATEHQVDLAYDPTAGRLHTVTDNTATPQTFTYGYQSSSYSLLETVTGPAHTVTNLWEPNRNVLDTKTNAKTFGTAATLSAYDYTVNSIGQRTAVSRSGSEVSSNIAWDYNNRGELVEEDFGDNDSADPRDRVYRYDGIGNRQKAAEGTLTLPATENYLANAVNEYATIPGAGGAIVSPDYDDDGNATAYPLPVNTSANASLVWDAENRLIEVAVLGVTYTYEYDYRGRRIAKDNGTTTTRYLYEGWNLCAEYTGATLAKTYTWGMDLSGSMQGAGGVGGLLAVTEVGTSVSTSYYPTYDGNGNVSEYLNSAGGSVAHYEYDAFGNEITAATTGAKSADFSHRFSTKYLDETGLYYYGYRYYDPVTGRWPSRDPIGELGGINLYGFVGNDGLNWVDVLGLQTAVSTPSRSGMFQGGELQREGSQDNRIPSGQRGPDGRFIPRSGPGITGNPTTGNSGGAGRKIDVPPHIYGPDWHKNPSRISPDAPSRLPDTGGGSSKGEAAIELVDGIMDMLNGMNDGYVERQALSKCGELISDANLVGTVENKCRACCFWSTLSLVNPWTLQSYNKALSSVNVVEGPCPDFDEPMNIGLAGSWQNPDGHEPDGYDGEVGLPYKDADIGNTYFRPGKGQRVFMLSWGGN